VFASQMAFSGLFQVGLVDELHRLNPLSHCRSRVQVSVGSSVEKLCSDEHESFGL
jgi:hypothetical protein